MIDLLAALSALLAIGSSMSSYHTMKSAEKMVGAIKSMQNSADRSEKAAGAARVAVDDAQGLVKAAENMRRTQAHTQRFFEAWSRVTSPASMQPMRQHSGSPR